MNHVPNPFTLSPRCGIETPDSYEMLPMSIRWDLSKISMLRAEVHRLAKEIEQIPLLRKDSPSNELAYKQQNGCSSQRSSSPYFGKNPTTTECLTDELKIGHFTLYEHRSSALNTIQNVLLPSTSIELQLGHNSISYPRDLGKIWTRIEQESVVISMNERLASTSTKTTTSRWKWLRKQSDSANLSSCCHRSDPH